MAGIWLYDNYNEPTVNSAGIWLTTTAFQFEVIKNLNDDALARAGYLQDDERWEQFMERMARSRFEERYALAVHAGICAAGLDVDTLAIDQDRETEVGAQVENLKATLADLGIYEASDRFETNILELRESIKKINDEIASVSDRQN